MRSSAACDVLDFDLKPDGVTLFGLPAERSAKRSLPGSTDDVFKTISSLRHDILADVIAKRTADEFEAAVSEALPRYFSLVLAFARIMTAMIPRTTAVRLSSESYSELEADIRQHGLKSFGSHMSERAVFTVWTLRKTADLLERLEAAPSIQEKEQERDAAFLHGFLIHAIRARFFVDCLIAAMNTRHGLYSEVLPVVDDGLKSAVNAYASVKQALDLRLPSDDGDAFQEPWTAEDQLLLDASAQDLNDHLE